MSSVLFVAPFFLDATVRFIEAVAGVPDIRLGLISQDPADKLPTSLRRQLSAHFRVADGMDAGEILRAARALSEKLGPPERIFGSLEQLQVQLAQVREALSLPGMTAVTANNFRDKARMKSIFESAGIPCARHQLAHGEGEAWAFVGAVGYPVVAKPPAGAGAKGTFRVNSEAQLRDVLGFAAPTVENPLLLEEFVQGEEHSFDSVFLGGAAVWHSISRYSPTPLEVLNHPWIQWTVLLPHDIAGPEYDDIRIAAERALQALGLRTGLTHMEWFRRPDGTLAISEVAARPPGAQFMTLISYAHDQDFYRAWAELMATGRFSPGPRRYACGAAFLRGQGRGRVARITGLPEATRGLESMVVETRLPRPGQAPSGSYEGEGYVVLRHESTVMVERGLKQIVSHIRVELEES